MSLSHVGVDIRVKNDFLVRWASLKNRLEVVKYLKSLGADIHTDNDYAVRWPPKRPIKRSKVGVLMTNQMIIWK